MTAHKEKKSIYERFWKRGFDALLSVLGLIVLALPMAVVAVIIKADDPGPAIFRQTRIGLHKKRFRIYKFRSMKVTAPPEMPTYLLEDPDRYSTRCGKVIRRMSIDELPQLFNILKGDMSFVGPRPALWNQEDLIAERDKYGANDVKPGLTGWAQIHGRDIPEVEEKARLDGEYVKNISFAFDCKCFFGSILPVLRQEGIVEGKPDA